VTKAESLGSLFSDGWEAEHFHGSLSADVLVPDLAVS
jgi:hypothetical protein